MVDYGLSRKAEEQWETPWSDWCGIKREVSSNAGCLPPFMFPTSKLFTSTLCPDYTSCKLQPCLFNHTPPVAIVGVRAPEASTSALPSPRPGVPQKRPGSQTSEGALKSSKMTAGGAPGRPVVSGSGTPSSSSRPGPAAGPSRPPPPAPTSFTARKPLVDVGGLL